MQRQETLARWLVLILVSAVLLTPLIARWKLPLKQPTVLEVHARVPEKGGWQPETITAHVGEPLHIRLTSDDVVHGFALGKWDKPSVDILPGEFVELTLAFDRPGKYVFYCTRWCGPNHWRMRGIIEVVGEGAAPTPEPPPKYLELGLDIDAPHLAEVIPEHSVDPNRGAMFANRLSEALLERETYLTHSPAQLWLHLRGERTLSDLSDDDLWDIVTWLWQRQAPPTTLELGRRLYAENCAACHGEAGKGDGVMLRNLHVDSLSSNQPSREHSMQKPPDFSDPRILLGASPALLEGKIIRGGMGTGMPYWGPILTPEQIDALVAYIYRFAWESARNAPSLTTH